LELIANLVTVPHSISACRSISRTNTYQIIGVSPSRLAVYR